MINNDSARVLERVLSAIQKEGLLVTVIFKSGNKLIGEVHKVTIELLFLYGYENGTGLGIEPETWYIPLASIEALVTKRKIHLVIPGCR